MFDMVDMGDIFFLDRLIKVIRFFSFDVCSEHMSNNTRECK